MKKFFKNLKTAWPRQTSGHANMLAMGSVGKPVFTPRYYEQLADEGYQRNVIVFRCVNLIARGLGSVPWLLYRNGSDQELEQHPLLNLLNCPSPQQAGSAFMEAVVSHLLLSGNAYVEAVLDNYGVQELYALWKFSSLPLKGGSEVRLALPFSNLLEIQEVFHAFTASNKERVRKFSVQIKNGIPYLCLMSKGVPIEVAYSAGFGPHPDFVPEAFHHVIKVLVAHWYQNREGSNCGIPDTVELFLRPYQIRRLI